MSRMFDMSVSIEEFDKSKLSLIMKALFKEWNFEDDVIDSNDKKITFQGQGCLTGGETDEEFAERIYKAVLKANGSVCKVAVTATDLENIPFEEYYLDKDEAKEILKALKGEE